MSFPALLSCRSLRTTRHDSSSGTTLERTDVRGGHISFPERVSWTFPRVRDPTRVTRRLWSRPQETGKVLSTCRELHVASGER